MTAIGKSEAYDLFPKQLTRLRETLENPEPGTHYFVYQYLQDLNDTIRVMSDRPAIACCGAAARDVQPLAFSRNQLILIQTEFAKIGQAVKGANLSSDNKQNLREFIYKWDNLDPDKEIKMFMRFLPKSPERLSPRELQAIRDFLENHVRKGGDRLEIAKTFVKNLPDVFYNYPIFENYFRSEDEFYKLNALVFHNFPQNYSKFQKLYKCFDIVQHEQNTLHKGICAGISFALVGEEKPNMTQILKKARFLHMLIAGEPRTSVTNQSKLFAEAGQKIIDLLPDLSEDLRNQVQALIARGKRYMPGASDHLQLAWLGKRLFVEDNALFEQIGAYFSAKGKKLQIFIRIEGFVPEQAKDVQVLETIKQRSYLQLIQILQNRNEGEFILVLLGGRHTIYVNVNTNSFCDQNLVSKKEQGPVYKTFPNKEVMLKALLSDLNELYPNSLADIYVVEKETYVP